MAESVHRAMKQRYNGKTHIHQNNAVAALSAMELMRQNVQNAFDRDIDTIIKKYMDVKKLFGQYAIRIVPNNYFKYFRAFLSQPYIMLKKIWEKMQFLKTAYENLVLL